VTWRPDFTGPPAVFVASVQTSATCFPAPVLTVIFLADSSKETTDPVTDRPWTLDLDGGVAPSAAAARRIEAAAMDRVFARSASVARNLRVPT
jgi:hypothetical protein